MIKLLQQAHQGAPLFPGQRALIRMAKAAAQVAGGAVIGQLIPVETLLGNGQYTEAAHLVLVVAASAVLAWLDKYYSAQRDSLLSPSLSQPNDTKTPAPAPAQPMPAPDAVPLAPLA